MLTGYWVATGVAVALYFLALAGSHYGWGLASDAQAMAQRSARSGSLHMRHYYGGGPGFGK